MKKYRLSLTIEEVRALKYRLIPISPSDYNLETYAILRNLYGRLEHLELMAEPEPAPAQASGYQPDPRD